MLDFAMSAGSTAKAGVISSGSPNCSLNANTLYLMFHGHNIKWDKRYDLMDKMDGYCISYSRCPSDQKRYDVIPRRIEKKKMKINGDGHKLESYLK
jgi:hypothetical protein